jgi:superfamily I DNA and/or RNA helicase
LLSDKAQVDRVCQLIETLQANGEEADEEAKPRKRNGVIKASTVDAFQGAEKEVIILTCARTGSLGFIDSSHRLNVAITRARRHLIIIGSSQVLEKTETWRFIISHIKSSPTAKWARCSDILAGGALPRFEHEN